jgi:Tol biopolymer transport system component
VDRPIVDDDQPSAGNGLIAFDTEGDIWADPDGSNARRLSDGPETERGPYWSPDGTRLAFIVDTEAGNSDLVHTDASGGARIVVARGVGEKLNHQSWSPDGTRLPYSAMVEGGTWQIFVGRSDGSGTAQLGDPDLMAKDPAWSPDGR